MQMLHLLYFVSSPLWYQSSGLCALGTLKKWTKASSLVTSCMLTRLHIVVLHQKGKWITHQIVMALWKRTSCNVFSINIDNKSFRIPFSYCFYTLSSSIYYFRRLTFVERFPIFNLGWASAWCVLRCQNFLHCWTNCRQWVSESHYVEKIGWPCSLWANFLTLEGLCVLANKHIQRTPTQREYLAVDKDLLCRELMTMVKPWLPSNTFNYKSRLTQNADGIPSRQSHNTYFSAILHFFSSLFHSRQPLQKSNFQLADCWG